MLAINGGVPEIRNKLAPYKTIDQNEINVVVEVMKSNCLSKFVGEWGEDFFGGPQILAFENEWKSMFGVKHAIAVNSWTSGLTAAIGAIGIEPGDEVIVSPWTMAASATSILHWNAIPIFADISINDFCLNPDTLEKSISPFTKAIMLVDIFGRSADIDKFTPIAQKYNLKIISDTAQSPGALYKGALAGTLTDIGGYSLNYHKHIHTGEGGIVVTNNDEFAERVQLIRNHAEAVLMKKKSNYFNNMIGYNFRLGEIEAAIGREQLKKLPSLILSRQTAAEKIIQSLKEIPGVTLPESDLVRSNVYYVLPIILDLKKFTVDRHKIFLALKAEGLEGLSEGYMNLHKLPMYVKKIAYGSKGFPWIAGVAHRDIDYTKVQLPIAEKLHSETFLEFEMCKFELNEHDIQKIINVFNKVLKHYSKK
jgi:perosamine synthetase